MKAVARPSFCNKHALVRLSLLLMLVAIQLGLFRTPALASAWQVYHCDPNTGTSMVEATLVDDTNNRELRGDYDSWYVVDADSSPDDDGRALYKATEDDTVEVYGDVNVIITDNTRWLVERIHLNNGAKLTIWSETGNKTSQGQLSAKTTSDHVASISVGEGATLVINGCYIHAETDTDDAAGIGGDKGMSAGTITINDGEVFASSKMNAAGIGAGKRGANGGNITINGGSVTGSAHDEDGAGIGGGEGGEGGNITINGGNVVAYGAECAAGIGGGCYSSAGNVTINGGTVTARGGEDGAGIGGGDEGSAGNITINGGTIEATGGEHGAGIGCGCDAYGKNADSLITITGGNITATGGESGAGIGSGYETNSHIINITGSGTVIQAQGGKDGAGIGGGDEGAGGTITIADATVSATGLRRAAGIGGGCGHTFDIIDITNANIRAVAVFGAGIGVSGSELYDDDADILSGGTINITTSNTFAASLAGGAGIGGGVFARADSITIRGGTTIAQGGSSYVHKKEAEIYGVDQLNEMLSAGFSEGFSVDIPDEVSDALGYIFGGFVFGDTVGDFLGKYILGPYANWIVSWFEDDGDTIYYAGAGIGCGHGADGGTINILDRAYVQAYDGRTDHDDYKYSFAIGSGKFKDNNTAITIYDEAMVTHGKMDPIGGNKFKPTKLGVATARAAAEDPSGILRNRELAQYAIISPGTFKVPVVKEWGSSLAVPSEVSVAYSNTYYMDSTTDMSDKSETATGSFQLSKIKDWRGEFVLRPQGTVSLSEAKPNGFSGSDWEQSWRLEIHYEKPITKYDEKGNILSVDTDRYNFAVKPTRETQDNNGTWQVFSFQRREDLRTTEGAELTEDMYNAVMEAFAKENGSATFVLTNRHLRTYSAQKTWLVDDAGQYKPASLDVALQQKQGDGTWKTIQTKELNDANEWKTNFDPVEDLGDDNYRVRELYNNEIVYNRGDSDITEETAQVNAYTYEDLAIGGATTDVTYDVTYEAVATGLTTITNTWRRPDTITIHGRKIWVDRKNEQDKRPNELKIYLVADGAIVQTQVIQPDAKNYWGWTFKDLPRTNDAGDTITYTITEDVPNGYTGVAAGQRLEGVKVADDSSEAEPADDYIDVQGYDLANVLNDTGGGGLPITPIVPIPPIVPVPPVPPVPVPSPSSPSEEESKDEDDKDEDDNEKVNIKVTKAWDDDNNEAGKRPASVTVRLLADGITKATATLNDSNGWTTTFANQPKKTSGEPQVPINYTVAEDPVEHYNSKVERDSMQELSAGGNCYKITNTYKDKSEKVTYSVKKMWNIDAAGLDRPTVLKAVLQKQTSIISWETVKDESGQDCVVDLTAANNWEAEFPAVKKKEDGKTIKYRIRELDKDGDAVYARGDHDYQKYLHKYFNEYVLRKMSALDSLTVLDCGDHLSEYLVKYAESGTRTTITNTAVREVSIKKFWLGANKPDKDAPIWNSIYLMLMSRPKAAAGGESVPYTPVYNALYGDGLDGDKALQEVAGFFNAESVLSVLTMATGFHASDYISYGLAAAKATEDNGWQVKFGVPKYDALGQEQEFMGAEVVTGILSMAVKGVTGIDTPVMIRPIDPKFVSVFGYAMQVPLLNKDYQRSCYVINTWLDPGSGDPDIVLGGVKYWDDGDSPDRPNEVVLHVYATQGDGNKNEVKGSPITVKASDGWAWSLPLTKGDLGLKEGDVINPALFSIKEDVPEGYEASYNDFDIVNKKKDSGDPGSETRDIVVTKHWDDGNNKDGIRPSNVRITVKANDKVVRNVVLDKSNLNQNNDWETLVKGLPKKDADGKEIVYTLDEERTDVLTGTDGPLTYAISSSSTDDSYVFINKHTPADAESQKKSLTVQKVWNDSDNQDGLRPSYVKVALKATWGASTTTVKTVTLDASNNWHETVTNLPTKWDGKDISYAWDEVVPSRYTAEKNTDGDTTTFTNTHTPETISVGVRKIWKDNDATKRPATLKVTLYANGAKVHDLTLKNQANETAGTAAWCGIVNNLPKYQGGKEIDYTWTEDETALPQGYTLTKTSVSGGVTTFTNTYDAMSTSTSVRKVWDDSDNAAGKRPEYVVMALYRKYNGVRESTPIKRMRLREGSGWKTTVSNLPTSYTDGTPVVYEWEEEPFDDSYELASKAVNGSVTTFTNAAKRNIAVSKVWDDENDFDGIRPSSVTVNLYADGTATGKSLTLSASNGWTGSFNDLAATKNGATIAYTVAEERTETIAGRDGVGTYNSTVSGTADHGYTITNVHTPEKTSVKASKKWADNNDQDGKRPESVKVRLLADGAEVRSTEISADSWSHTFADLPVYRGTSKIAYTVEEEGVPADYTSNVTGDAAQGFTITNTHSPETMSVDVHKVWDDANDQDGKRPTSVTVHLLADNTDTGKALTLKADKGWNGSFTDLPVYQGGKAITYTVSEDEVDGYDDLQIAGGVTEGFTITNTHTPEKTSVRVGKVWDDGDASDSHGPVTVRLYANGEVVKDSDGNPRTLTLSINNDWSGTFPSLPKYSGGREIVYTVSEDAVENYATTVTGNQNKGFTVTNKRDEGKTQVNVHKVWEDDNDRDGIRPSSVEVTLYRRGVDDPLSSVTLNAANGWSGTFSGLDAEGTYFVEEEEVPNGYSSSKSGENGRDFTITNTHTPETTSVKVKKVWSDNDNANGMRPEKVTIRLYANGEVVKDSDGNPRTLTLPKDGGWAGEFTGLSTHDGGHEIAYTVSEDAVANYMTIVSGNASTGFTITNKYDTNQTSVRVIKRWDDANDQDGIRPSNVVVRLVADGKETTKTLRLSATNGWSGTFGGLETGKTYTVEEAGVPEGYSSSVTTANSGRDFIITNTHAPEKTSVKVTKVWDDAENQDGVRPTSVTVYLLADGVRTGQSLELSADALTGTFDNLPAKKSGKAIEYSVEEEAVAGYTSAISGNATSGYTIKNTHNPETVDVTGTKTWVDNNNSGNTRPDKITIRLLVGDNEVDHKEVQPNTDGSWSWTFQDKPKYAADTHQEITYTVTEDKVDYYETTYDRKHLNITNTYVPTTSVKVEKKWDDTGASGSVQHPAVTVRLYANGTQVASHEVAAGEDDWDYTFANLPTKKNGVTIDYTVSEDAVENYTTDITGDAANDFTITNKYSTEGKTQVSVRKVWDDDNDRDRKRPESVTVTLKKGTATADTATLNAGNQWSHTFVDLDATSTYTVSENAVADYETAITGDDSQGFTITNTHTPETVGVSGAKTWEDANNQDGLRPSSITINLLANGTKIDDAEVKPDSNGDWKWNFTNLPKYDGVDSSGKPKEIEYTVTENNVPGYQTTYGSDVTSGLVVTNTHIPATMDVRVNKVWDDNSNQDGVRPGYVTVWLQKNGVNQTQATLNADNWSYTFENLPKYENGVMIDYTVTEEVPAAAVEYYTTDIKGTAAGGYTITNTHISQTVNVTGNKIWDDNNDQDGMRPSSIAVHLLANGTEVDHKEVRPDADGNWSWNFAGVPKNQDGSAITYTVTEDPVSGYETTYDQEHLNVTNTHESEKTSVKVTKVWDDGSSASVTHPKVTVRLYADGTQVDSHTVDAGASDWTHTFQSKPKYDHGREIVYTVSEDAVENYTTTVTGDAANGFTVTNKRDEGKTQVNVHKVWIDDNDRDGIRPESVTVKLLAGGADTGKTLTLNAGNGWSDTFTDLPVKDGDNSITYTVSEANVPVGYTADAPTGNASQGFTITNRHTPETMSVVVKKEWAQGTAEAWPVKVHLYANGRLVNNDPVELTDGNRTHTFDGLHKYENGAEIVYTVTEDALAGYSSTVESTTSTIGNTTTKTFTITNAKTDAGKTQVSVVKRWDDANDQDGIRPGSVVVRLLADGKDAGENPLTLNADNGWSGTFNNLPVKTGSDKNIAYSVVEDTVPGYTATYGGNATQGFSIANAHTPETVNVSGTKTWDDNNNQDGIRPDSITIRLKVGDNEVDHKVVRPDANGNWLWTFSRVPKYDANTHAEIAYTVTEDSVENYTTAITGNATSGFNVANTHAPATRDVSVTKVWDDRDHESARPTNGVTVRLYADGKEIDSKNLNETGRWTHTFTNLPTKENGREIVYTVSEDAVTDYTTTVAGNQNKGFTVTNKYSTEGKTQVSVRKVWDDDNDRDGKRPASVTVKLLAGGADTGKTCELNAGNGWSGTFADLPVKDNDDKTISYTVSENRVADYDEQPTVAGTAEQGFTITNKHTTEKMNVVIRKVWPNGTTQADSVTVHLYANGRLVESGTVTLSASSWTHTFENLPKYENGAEIVYTVTEDAIAGYASKVESKTSTSGNTTTKTFTITNTATTDANKTQVSVVKRWDDDNDRDCIRPGSVAVRLLADGKDAGKDPLTLSDENGWSDTFNDLPVKAKNGKDIAYSVVEQPILGYTATYGGNATSGFSINNVHTPDKTSVKVTKHWDDANNQDGKRPKSVSVYLLADGVRTGQSIELSEATSWQGTFTNLAANKAGEAIEYSVEEETIADYEEPAIAGDATQGYTITNKHEPEKIEVSGTKVWTDDNDQDGLRPRTITIHLKANDTEVASQTVSASSVDEQGGWTWKFTGVPKYKDGTEITYTVTEDGVDGYDVPQITGSVTEGYTITNTHEPQTVDVSGTKTWSDTENQDGIRPSSITIRLKANGEEFDHKVVRPDANGNWSWTFSRVPKYVEGTTTEIVYTVTEDEVSGYKTTYDQKNLNVTNTHTPAPRSVSVTKVWDDSNDAEHKRPGSVTVRLYADGSPAQDISGNPVAAVNLSADNWSDTFTNLPKYRAGKEIVYTVTEDAVKDYTATVSGNATDGFTVTNKYDKGKTQVSVRKVWDDDNDQDGKRPAEVEVALKNGAAVVATQKLNAGNNWSHTFTGLDDTKTYTVEETSVPKGYNCSVTPTNGTNGKDYTITNKHTSEKMNVVVNKVWKDGTTQADSVTVHLYANGRLVENGTQVLRANNWTHDFGSLPKYENGAEIVYSVTEDAIAGYTSAVKSEISTSGNTTTKTFTITNTATTDADKTQVSVIKRWDDANNQDGIRPGSVAVILFADGSNTGKSLQLKASNNWSGTFGDLAVTAGDGAPITYTISELPVPGYATVYGGNAKQGFTISNSHTPATTSVSVSKQWNDANNQDGFRPNAVTVHLLADGMRTGKTLELSAANNWSGTFGDLARRKAGADIAYTVEEETTDVITGKDAAGTYKYDVTGTAADGYTITNTHTPEVVNVSGTKTWDDADNQDGKRPASIRLRLIADGSQVATKDVKPAKDGSWTWNFGDWPKYKDGREIDYRISEDGVSGYTTTYDKFNVTNKHTPETTSVSVKKAWNDDNDRDGKRPERVTVRLSAKVGDTVVEGVDGREVTLEKSHNWSATFTDLPKYQGGKEITYTVSEPNAPAGYTAGEATGDAATGFTITNTHTPERTDILIKKVWVDEGNADKRPDAVTFRLYANGAESKTVTRTLSDWDGTVSTRDYKYAGGREIVYTLTEDTVNGYKTEVARTKSDNATNFTVTNTYLPTRTQVNVHKVWDDDNNRDGKRPTSVTVKLLADGNDTNKTLTLNAEGGWSGTFSELEVGKEYAVSEDTVTDYKAPVVTGTAKQGFTITNKRTPDTVNVSGLKTWADNNNQDGKRPNSVTIRVYADGEEVASKQFDASTASGPNTWNWSFADLPKYDGVDEFGNPKAIGYTVSEDAVADYTTSIDGFNITNTHTPEKAVVVGSKIWDDGNNRAGRRPEFIRITLHASPEDLATTLGQSERTKEVRASDNWRWEWSNLPKYQAGQPITYTVTEEAVPDYTTTYAGPFVVNTYAEGKTSVSVTKRWNDANNQDGIRPDEVVVSLYANGRYTGKVLYLNAAGGWAGAFGDLDAKDGSGKDITYTVSERAVDGYTTTYDGNAKTGFVVTNRHTPETTNISVRKIWNDDNNAEGVRPPSVIARLLVNGIWTDKICELKAETSWRGTFEGVPKYYAGEEAEYSVNEQLTDRVPNTNTPNTYNYAVEGNATDGFTITNTLVPETVNIVGTKTWDDQDHEDKRPASITVRLYANGREVASQEVKPTENGAWKYGFYNQPKREAGAEIVYTVSEDAVPDYTAHYTATTSGYNITNTYVEGKTQVSVRKVWDDENNRDGKRPGSVTVSLKNGSTTVGTATLKADNQWSCTFDVPDTAGTYTVEESGVPADYTSSVAGDAKRGFTITNTHTPSKTEKIIPVTVIYDDAHDQDGLRGEVFPTKVPVTNGGADTGIAVDVNGGLTNDGANDKWTDSFTYAAYSNEDLGGLQVAPTTSENYSVEVTGSATEQTGFTITYTHVPQTTQVQVNKVWDDNNNAASKRPSSVTVRLYADGAPAKDASDQALTATMTTNKWSATFEGLPKYRAGKEIDYTISEDAVANYASVISGPELSDGVSKYRVYTVTNTYTEGKTQVNVRKVWDDENDRDGIRPSSVTVKLKEGDTVTDNTLTLSEANGWTGTFTGLDATKTYGVEEEQVTGYESPNIQPDTPSRDYVITNTHTPENVKVVVNKVWKDAAHWPVTIRLYANGRLVDNGTVELTDGNQSHTFENLPKYENGAEIVYTVTEDVIDGYDSVVASTTEESGGTTTKTFTVTNLAHTETNKTQVNVTKRWDDANNQDGIRPNMVNVRLLANGEDTGKVLRLTAANSWAGSFRGLDMKTSDGAAIVYTVAEDAIDGYEVSVTGDVTAGYVVTNTHVPETVEVAGSKTWDDNDDAEGARPLSITIRLRANGTEVANRTVTAADGWAWSFTDLPARKNGVRIQYTIAEDAVRDYSSHIAGYDAVNTYAPGKTQVQVHHIWDDEDNVCGLRTNHVVVHLYANGVDTGRTLVLGEWPSLRTTSNDTQNDPWSGTFENLDLNDENGRPIIYTVREGEVPHYTNSQSGSASQGFVLVDAHDPETITLRGTKTWDDNGNEDGSRPTGVLIRLYADGVEDTSRAVYVTNAQATDANTWTWKIADLQRYYGLNEDGTEHEITYTISEDVVPNYSATVSEPTTAADGSKSYTLTNTHKPWTTDIRVVKVWNDDENRDGIRPAEVKVRLLANGKDTGKSEVLNEASHWECVFAGLPTKEDNREIEYTVEEEKTSVITGTDGTGTYAISTNGSAERGFTITNTHTPDKVNIAGTKVWDDGSNQDGLRPYSVNISLLANGVRVDGISLSGKQNGDAASGDTWNWEFVGKPKYENGKEIIYTVTEDSVEHYNTLITGNAASGFTITNTHVPGVRNVEGHKLWVDENDQDGVRPKSVTVHLLADGKEVASRTLTAGDRGINANVWDYSFKNVPVWNDGHEIEYTVTEDAVEGYETNYVGLNITNTHVPETVDVTVRKDWTGDAGNEAARQQQVVYVQLRANNRVVRSCELSEANEWTYTFAGVPKNAGGRQISYTVSENVVDNYTSSVTGTAQGGYTITNAYTPGLTQVNVYKVWDDDYDRDRVRPAAITVQLMRGEGEGAVPVEGKVLELSEGNGWTGSFDQLPMYEELEDGTQGARIRYSVQESVVDGYGLQTNGNMYEGFSLINRHVPDLIDILGAKTWVDNDNAAGLRPESIRIRLRANGADVNGRSVSAGDNWAWDFTGVPKFDAGQEIAYSISEDVVDKYETTYEGYNVTNTYRPDITNFKVTKVWNDSNNADGVRPESVTVRLYADSVDTGLAFTLSAANKTDDNTWVLEATGLDLPATKEGHAISYVLVEDSVASYTSDVTGDIAKGFVVTNTHTVTPPPSPDPDPTIYTITYVLNGGSYDGSTDDIVEKYPAGTGILIHEAPTREGYTFDYWKGSAYQPGDVYTVTEDHTFEAQWKSNGGDTPQPDGGDTSGAGTNDNSSGSTGSTGSATSSPASGAGRTTSSAPLARTSDDSALALAGVAVALFGTSALALARRRR